MRTPPLLYSALFVSLAGCVQTQQPTQPPADQWVDNQIAMSATALSLAQQRLHSTSAATEVTSQTGSAPLSTAATEKPAPVVSTPIKASPVAVISPTKAFPVTPAPQPTIINVVAAPVAAAPPAQITAVADKPGAVGGPGNKLPVVGTPAVPMSALITKPASATPAVKPAPPKPVWEARLGESLQQVIQRWSQTSGYTVDWRADGLDYPIDAPLRFQGTYEEAVFSIFKLYEKAERSFVVDGRRRQHRLIINEELNSIRRASK